MRIAVLLIATGKYTEFVPTAVDGIERLLLAGRQRTIFLWTDGDSASFPACTVVAWPHLPWPSATLHRYRAFAMLEPELRGYDYVFYLDVDMRIVAPIAGELLGDLVAIEHPHQSQLPANQRTYERRPESRACIPLGMGDNYFCGGVQGGSGASFMDAVLAMRTMIDDDLARGIVPLWHDESVWNRYLLDHPPSTVLPPSYCFPEGKTRPYPPKIVALEKDHKRLRGVGGSRVPDTVVALCKAAGHFFWSGRAWSKLLRRDGN